MRTPDTVRSRKRKAADTVAAARLPLRPASRSLSMQLTRAREAVMQRFRPVLRCHGITDQQWRIIRVLVEVDALEILDLGDRCCLQPASLSRILPNMEAVGLIVRRAHPQDLRRVVVSITPRGRCLFEAVAPRADEIYADITRDVGPARLQQLYRLLDHTVEALSPEE
jgi:homoprotocatechuate degradation regulator HpaR